MVKGNYYGILGVAFEASSEEIQTKYRELSLKNHSDKGGESEEFKKVANAYEVLGNPHQRLKYDLGLLKDGKLDFAEYIESEKWGTVYRFDEVISNELWVKFINVLQKELEISGLSEEDLSNYGTIRARANYRVVLEKASGVSREVSLIMPFCQSKIRNQTFKEAVERTRKYLEVITDAHLDKETVSSAVEEIMPGEELSKNPPLTKEELDDHEGHKIYDSYCEKTRAEILKKTHNNRKEEIAKKTADFAKIVKPLKDKINQRREEKKELLRELSDWLENGENLLVGELENRQEQITEFINNFSDYLNLKKNDGNYATKIISQKIQEENKKNDIKDLIRRLENYKEKELEEEFIDLSPVSEEEKSDFILYLDKLIFDYLAPPGTDKNPTSLRRIRNNFGLVYEAELESAINKGESENIRAKTIKNICEVVLTSGGSDEELVNRVKKINSSFYLKISNEIEKKLECKIKDLLPEEQYSLKPKKGELSQVGFAKKLVKRKAKILENNIRIVCQRAAVKAVNDYWKDNQDDKHKINGKVIAEVLGEGWNNSLLAEDTEEKIKEKRDELIALIQTAKTTEKKNAAILIQSILRGRQARKELQDSAVNKVKSYWNTKKRRDNTINGENQTQILGGNWEGNFSVLNTVKKIEREKSRLITLIDGRKSAETTIIEKTISFINEYWNNKVNSSGKINGKNKNVILGEEWEKTLREKVLIKKMTEKKEELVEKINENKAQEELQKIRDYREEAVRFIDDYWNEKVGGVDEKINDKSKDEVLSISWKWEFDLINNEEQINQKVQKLKNFIKQEVENLKNKAIEAIRKHWNDKQKDNKINLQSREYFLPENWKRGFGTKKSEIEAERRRLIDLMDKAKQTEIENRNIANASYDNLLNQINKEKNQNIDYPTLINNLDWTYLNAPQTKKFLLDAWTVRKSRLEEMRQREWERNLQQTEEERKKEEQYRDIKERIENGGEYVNHLLEIEKLASEEQKTELRKLLESKWCEWEQAHSEEERLNKELERLRNPSFLNNIFNLLEEKTILKKLRLYYKGKNPIDKWFSGLEELLRKNDYQFLKEVCGKVPDNKREELFSEIFSELEKERKDIKSKKDFGESSYFTKIKENEIRKYLQEIFKTVNEKLDKIADWEDDAKDDVNSIMKEVEKFEHDTKNFQKKIKKSLQKLANKITASPKDKKDLNDEKIVMDSIIKTLEKVEEVEESIKICKEVSRNYLKGKNLTEAEIEKWISNLEKANLRSGREVALYMKKMVNEFNNSSVLESNVQKNGSITKVLAVVGVISGLIVAGVALVRKRLNRKIKKD